MSQSTIYIRKENEERWKSIPDKSAWVNAYLEKSPPNSKVIEEELEPVVTEEPEEEYDILQDYIYDTVNKVVCDTATGEAVQADAEMIKELKKLGRVKNG